MRLRHQVAVVVLKVRAKDKVAQSIPPPNAYLFVGTAAVAGRDELTTAKDARNSKRRRRERCQEFRLLYINSSLLKLLASLAS